MRAPFGSRAEDLDRCRLNGDSVYSGAVEEVPAPAPVATLPAKAAAVGDDLLKRAREDPAVFARLMEEVFGLQETWAMPTEELLRSETKHVEFKQTTRWDVNLGEKSKLIEQIVCSTVADFIAHPRRLICARLLSTSRFQLTSRAMTWRSCELTVVRSGRVPA